jgi:hypothetical protein
MSFQLVEESSQCVHKLEARDQDCIRSQAGSSCPLNLLAMQRPTNELEDDELPKVIRMTVTSFQLSFDSFGSFA